MWSTRGKTHTHTHISLRLHAGVLPSIHWGMPLQKAKTTTTASMEILHMYADFGVNTKGERVILAAIMCSRDPTQF